MKELKIIEDIVRDASKIMLGQSGDKGIEVKTSNHDLVTMYDKMTQERLYESLSKVFPDAGFLGEESLTKESKNGGVFIIDPIDGTTNFVKGLNHSGISVGYCVNDVMTYGVVYNPYKDEMFTAKKGCGAFLNGKEIHVSDAKIEASIAHYGTAPYNPELCDKSFKLAAEITKRVIDTRRFGAATLDFCDIACGRAEIFVEYILRPWDLAAGSLIAEEAGAIVTDIDGKPLQYKESTSILVGTKNTYSEVKKIIDGLK